MGSQERWELFLMVSEQIRGPHKVLLLWELEEVRMRRNERTREETAQCLAHQKCVTGIVAIATAIIITNTIAVLSSIILIIFIIFRTGLLFKSFCIAQSYIHVNGHRNFPLRMLVKGRRWVQPPSWLPAYISCHHEDMIVSFLLLLQSLGKAIPPTPL